MQPRGSYCAAYALALLAVAGIGMAQDGVLDPTFSSDGRQTAGFENPPNDADSVRAVAVQPDGRIVAAGSSCSSPADCLVAVARFLPGGVPDGGFDGDGERLLTFGAPSGSHQGVEVLVRPQDGKLVVVGRQSEGFLLPLVGLARLTTDGALDPGFGSSSFPGSIAHLLPGGEITAVTAAASTSTGRILVGGYGSQSGASNSDGFVARFLENGVLDTTFGEGGATWIAFDQGQANSDILQDLAVQADGRIVALFRISDSGHAGDADTGIARLLSGGTLDTGFDGDTGSGNGKVIFQFTDFGGDTVDSPQGLVLQPDGRILFSGNYDLIGAGGDPAWYFGRLLSDGSTDPALAARVPTIATPSGELGGELLLQSDGKLLLSGYTLEGDCLALRYDLALDEVDASFGTAGLQSFTGELLVGVRCLASTQAGGKLVVAGGTVTAPDDDFFVARLKSSLIFSDGFESGSSGQWSF
jgi:uncharacterized delta-60 repeat protein